MIFNAAWLEQKKKLLLILMKQKKNCLNWNYNIDNSYSFIKRKEIYKFKDENKNVNFPTQFTQGRISEKFRTAESRGVRFKRNGYDVLVDYNAIDKSDILNICKY